MSARARVAAIRVVLSIIAIGSALAWATAALLGLSALWRDASLLDSVLINAPAPRAAIVAIALFAGVIALWRARHVWSLAAVALWLEERDPALRYSLVTALDVPDSPHAPALEREVAARPLAGAVTRECVRLVLRPLGALLIAIVLMFFAPHDSSDGAGLGGGGRPGAAPPMSAPSRLAPLTATVTPPAYSGLQARTFEEPSAIPGLVASRVTLDGKGASGGISAQLNGVTLAVEGKGVSWRMDFIMPAKAAALSLTDRQFHRLIILEPRPDSAPVVTLLAPPHDTVFRTPNGALALSADARDDFGLADAWLEYIISSGEGESFTFRSGIIGRVDAKDSRTASVQGTLRLDDLKLKAGDIVHIRAVARDRNDATGPDTGASETRTLRIARKDEYDSVAVEGAPPPDADKSIISERMLIMLTEDLQRRRPKLAREAMVAESQHIGRDQTRLRKEVSRVIFARLGAGTESEESNTDDDDTQGKLTPDQMLAAADSATNESAGTLEGEGDETPIVALNRPLLEAYNAMWEASARLNTGEPGDALPFMRTALAAIQRARAAERLYLRGRSPATVVDLSKVRLAGKRDDAVSATRAPRSALDTTAMRRVQRLNSALAVFPADPSAAVDSLQILRVDAIAQDPAFAAALGPAIDSLRAGHYPMLAVARARRAAAGAPAVEKRGTSWEGAP